MKILFLKKQGVRNEGIDVLPLAFLLACYSICIISFAINGRGYTDADIASEVVLSDMLNHEGGLLTMKWYYSTELRVLNTQIFYRIGLLFFSDWHAARTCAIALMLVLLIASYLFLVRVLRLGRAGIWTASVFALPFSGQYMYSTLYGGFYYPHLAIMFFAAGVTACCSESQAMNKKNQILLASGAAVAFLSGLGGIRQLLVSYIPLCVASLLMSISCLRKRHTVRELYGMRPVRLMIISVMQTVAFFFGWVINMKVLSGIFRFNRYESQNLNSLRLSELIDYLGETVRTFGYEGAISITGGSDGVIALSSLVLIIVLTVVIVYGFLSRKELSEVSRFILLLFVSGLFLNAFFYWAGSLTVPRYLLPSALMAIPACAIVIKDLFEEKSPGRYIVIVMVLCCALLQGYKNWFAKVRVERGTAKSAYETVTDWLLANDLHKGFSYFWQGNVLTELSNGEIEMWVLRDGGDGGPIYDWLQKTEHEEVFPSGKTFLVVVDGFKEQYETLLPGAIKAFTHGGFSVYTYEDAEVILHNAGLK